eukprot:3786715-Amphidinium_carterae.1
MQRSDFKLWLLRAFEQDSLFERAQHFRNLVDSVKIGMPLSHTVSHHDPPLGASDLHLGRSSVSQPPLVPELNVSNRLAALEEWTNQFGISTYLDSALGQGNQQVKVEDLASNVEAVIAHLTALESRMNEFVAQGAAGFPPPPPRLSSFQAQFDHLNVQVQKLQQRSQALTSRMMQTEFGCDLTSTRPDHSALSPDAPSNVILLEQVVHDLGAPSAARLSEQPSAGAQQWLEPTEPPAMGDVPDTLTTGNAPPLDAESTPPEAQRGLK